MDIDLLVRNSIEKISDKWGLPKKGFITGGSISNLVWEEVSGNKAIINDIDVFLLDSIAENFEADKKKYLYSSAKEEDVWYEDYNGINFMTNTKDFYSIIESSNDGIFNYVKYKSNTKDPMVIINSFDINSVCVGYSIDLDKVFYTDDFVDFLKTQELKVINLKTPCHTAIRIIKKSRELNCKLDDFEFKVIQHSIIRGSSMKNYKVRFQERYFELFKTHMDKLSEFFYIEKDLLCMQQLKHQGIDSNLWRLLSNKDLVFSDKNLYTITNPNEFLFYIRNVYNDTDLRLIWEKVHYLYSSSDYIDKIPSKKDLELLGNIVFVMPNTINNLKGLKISEQINLIKRLLGSFKDKLIPLKILEKNRLDKDIVLDYDTRLLLELSVRKEIISDDKHIVERILNKKKDVQTPVDVW